MTDTDVAIAMTALAALVWLVFRVQIRRALDVANDED
jgi:hypothetical protein